MNMIKAKNRQKGSVLIICVGLLAMMALLAAALVSTVQLQRGGAKNFERVELAKITALSGKEYAIDVLRTFEKNLTNKVTTSSFDAKFFTGGTVKDLWRFYGINDITSSEYIAINKPSKWIGFGYFSRDFKRAGSVYDVVNYPIEKRFAVGLIDLSGTLPINSFASEDYSDQVDAVMEAAPLNATSGKLSGVYDDNSLSSSKKSFSWLHARGAYINDGGVPGTTVDKIFLQLSPFGADYFQKFGLPGTPRPAFNINTCSKSLLQQVYQETKNGGAGALGATTWAHEVVNGRPYSDFDVDGVCGITNDEGVKSICNDNDGTNDPTDEKKAVARAFIADRTVYNPLFFRIMVRGQVYDKALDKVLSEANLELVYYVDGDNSHVLYQHWIDKDR